MNKLPLLLGGIVFLLFSDMLIAQSKDTAIVSLEGAPKVYLDCNSCDLDYIRREIPFVNYVRDRHQADIVILVTIRTAGNRGGEYTLTFTGNNEFEGITDTLLYNTTSFDTEDVIRSGFVRKLKLGLIPYLIKTPIAESIDISFEEDKSTEDVKDAWDFWVFRLRASGSLNKEQFVNTYDISGDINADRITEDWKIRLDLDINYDEENFDFEDEEPWSASTRHWSLSADIVKSISSHWSLGGFLGSFSSTFRNIKSAFEIAPAIEFNIYPYIESTYHEIRIDYRIGFIRSNYYEETLYGKTNEDLFRHALRAVVEIKQPWGEINLNAEYSQFLNDLSNNRLQIWGWLSLNLFEGFAFDLGGGYSKIGDQIYLPKRDLTIEEILLRRAEIATEYSYQFSLGVSYTFGAIYNNIVNPRFGD
jgi:hypothetical protein